AGKKWAEIESAINRLPDPTTLEIRVIKTIGILRVIGEIGRIKPSRELLNFALVDETVTREEVAKTLESLEKRSIIIYRRYSESFSLWEGSDLDIEEKMQEAFSQIDIKESLAFSLTKHFNSRPMLARHHSFRTGTTRIFEVRYADVQGFADTLNKPLLEA